MGKTRVKRSQTECHYLGAKVNVWVGNGLKTRNGRRPVSKCGRRHFPQKFDGFVTTEEAMFWAIVQMTALLLLLYAPLKETLFVCVWPLKVSFFGVELLLLWCLNE